MYKKMDALLRYVCRWTLCWLTRCRKYGLRC